MIHHFIKLLLFSNFTDNNKNKEMKSTFQRSIDRIRRWRSYPMALTLIAFWSKSIFTTTKEEIIDPESDCGVRYMTELE